MSTRPYTIGAVACMTLMACVIFFATLLHAAWYGPAQEEAAPPASVSAAPAYKPTQPSRLIIPALEINAAVQDVGIGKTGNMAVPLKYADVGWYRYGPYPGQAGSAVIDGHVDNGFGLAAVFKNINTLKPGDDIYIEAQSGTRKHFIVEEVGQYLVTEVPLQKIFNRTDKARLNLITCAGDWVAQEEAYDSRTVVYAVLAS